MNLEVVWDGSHGNQDQDLLCTPKIPEKRHYVPVDHDLPLTVAHRAPTRHLVEAVLERGPATKRQLIAETRLTYGSICCVVDRLLADGVIRRVGTKRVSKYRAQNMYGLTE